MGNISDSKNRHNLLKFIFHSSFFVLLALINFSCQKDESLNEFKIDSIGGAITSKDGLLKLTIPSNAFSSPTVIKIQEAVVKNPYCFKGIKSYGKIYSIEPSDIKFSNPIMVEISYKDVNIVDPENLGVLHMGTGEDKFIDLISPEKNVTDKMLNFSINHFSQLQIIETPDKWAVFNFSWIIPTIKWYLETPIPASYLNESNIQYSLDLWSNQNSSFIFERTYDKGLANIIFTEVRKITEFVQYENWLHIHGPIGGMACLDFWSNVTGEEKCEENDHVNIIFASEEFNDTNEETNIINARETIAHEIGHAIGIAHAVGYTNPFPLMNNYTFKFDPWNGQLHQWDINALHYHYLAVPEISNTKWDVTINFNTENSWHADVTFNTNGTTKYDEPAYPGLYLSYGSWSQNGKQIHWDIGQGTSYVFDGIITGSSMSGTFIYRNETKTWSAIKK